MALDKIVFTGPNELRERSAGSFVVAFRDEQAFAKAQPTNVYYRLDDDGTGLVLLDWTPVTAPVLPANSVTLTITPEQNRIVRDSCELERKSISVMANRGLATQFVGSFTYGVRNLGWPS